MIESILSAFWFFLPAGIANMMASLSGVIPKLRDLSYPMDFYKHYKGQRILGEHKTIRGLVMGTLFGALTSGVLNQPLILGLLLGIGAILGDALKSFFKRQMQINPGDSFLFFDQVDYIVGGILLSMLHTILTWQEYAYIILVYFVLHLVVNVIGYLIGVRKQMI